MPQGRSAVRPTNGLYLLPLQGTYTIYNIYDIITATQDSDIITVGNKQCWENTSFFDIVQYMYIIITDGHLLKVYSYPPTILSEISSPIHSTYIVYCTVAL